MSRPKILSYGGGLDSFAMRLTAIDRGELPDVVVFMDTGHPLDPGEWPGTYRHIDEVARPICAQRGVEFVKIDHTNYPVRGGTKGAARSLFAWWQARRSMPMAGPGRQCTTIAKVERFEKWATDRFPGQDVEVWIGFEAGEDDRVKKDPNTGANRKEPKRPKKGAKAPARRHNRFPLMEQGLCRCRCEALVRASGYPVPRIVWTDPVGGDRYAAHAVRRGRDAQGIYAVIEFEDDEGLRSVRVHPSQLEDLR